MTFLQPPRYVINTAENSAKFEVFVGDQFVTRYVLENGIVNMSEIFNAIIVPKNAFINSVTNLKKWVSMVQNNLIIERKTVSAYKEEMQKTFTNLKVEKTVNGQSVLESYYKNDTSEVCFLERPEVNIHWYDFVHWYEFLNKYKTEIMTF